MRPRLVSGVAAVVLATGLTVMSVAPATASTATNTQLSGQGADCGPRRPDGVDSFAYLGITMRPVLADGQHRGRQVNVGASVDIVTVGASTSSEALQLAANGAAVLNSRLGLTTQLRRGFVFCSTTITPNPAV